jgi:hypothetical protein
MSLLSLLPHVDPSYLPLELTQAGQMLRTIANSGTYSTKQLCIALGGSDPRSARQALTNSTYGYWNIINKTARRGMAIYQLDPRHLTGSPLDDANARAEAKRRLLKCSKDLAESETRRQPIALERYETFIQESLPLDKASQNDDQPK